MSLTIDELLKGLQNPSKQTSLENTRDTWERIGNKDSFEELGLSSSELESFLAEWISENPYSHI